MKKILITGCNGFLGQRLCAYYKEKYQIIAVGHNELDICNKQQVNDFFRQTRPDAVFHCAAISDTGYSQNHPEESKQVNVEGTVNIAENCRIWQAKLIYMSSDQVYNGNVGLRPWNEEDSVYPKSVYGADKLDAENKAFAITSDTVSLRLTWMYDLPESKWKLNRNLPVNLLQAWQNKEHMKAATREYRGITNVWEVVKNMELCLQWPGGSYNFGSMNEYNSYDTFMAFARKMNLPNPETWIEADTERFPEHPRNLMIDNRKAQEMGARFLSSIEGFQPR